MKIPCFSLPDGDREASKQIDKELGKVFKLYKYAIKILLLGAGEAGKTTILKQMKILHIQGFTNDEKLERAIQIRKNVHEAITELLVQLEPLGLVALPNTLTAAAKIKEIGACFTDEYFDLVQSIWNDQAVKKCLKRSYEFQLIDCAEYFLERIEIVRKPDYIPDDSDILQCRQMTTGIQKLEFKIKVPKGMQGGTQEFWIFDVGGQRGQRKKWIQVFEGINAVWFLVASSDFDLKLREDVTQNRLQEAINIFGDVWRSKFLIDAGLIVFLNKQDILERKVNEGRCIGDYFPEYHNFKIPSNSKTMVNEYTRTKLFIKNMLVETTQLKPSESMVSLTGIPSNVVRPRECYYHFTVATDTNNIKKVFDDVHHLILTTILTDIGI